MMAIPGRQRGIPYGNRQSLTRIGYVDCNQQSWCSGFLSIPRPVLINWARPRYDAAKRRTYGPKREGLRMFFYASLFLACFVVLLVARFLHKAISPVRKASIDASRRSNRARHATVWDSTRAHPNTSQTHQIQNTEWLVREKKFSSIGEVYKVRRRVPPKTLNP